MEKYIPRIIATAIVIILLPLTKYVFRKLIRKYGELLQKTDGRVQQTKQIISILLNVVFIFLIIIIWGVEPRNLLLGLSSVFAVIGVAMFAQWSVLSNITAGVIMFFSAPFKIGSRIHIMDKDIPILATIEKIEAFYTHIRTDDDELIVIPNNIFLQKIVSVKEDGRN